MEDEHRKRTLTPKGKDYQIEIVNKDLKRVRSKLTSQLSIFEMQMKEKNIDGGIYDLQKVDENFAELQTIVERYTNLLDENEEEEATKKAELLQMLNVESEGVMQAKEEMERWLKENQATEEERQKTDIDIDKEIEVVSDMLQEILKPNVAENESKEKKSNQDEQKKDGESSNNKSNLQLTIEVMRMQMKLDNQISLFGEVMESRDIRMIAWELKRLEGVYNEMTGMVQTIKGTLSTNEDQKVTDIIEKSELEVNRMRALAKGTIEMLEKEDIRSEVSRASSRTRLSMMKDDKSEISRTSKGARTKETGKGKNREKNETKQKGISGSNDSLNLCFIRLENQRSLINDLLGTTNTKMMCKELQMLDKLYDQMKEHVNTIDKTSPKRIGMADKVDEEDAEINKIKREAVKWTRRQRESEKGSRRSHLSKSSRRTDRTGETGRSSKQSKYNKDIKILNEQLNRNQRRLTDQHVLVEELMKENDPDTLSREIDMMERFHQNTIAVIENLRSVIPSEEDNNLLNWIEEEEARIVETKKKYIQWLVKQEEIDNRSVGTRSSRKTFSEVTNNLEKERAEDESYKREKLEKKIEKSRSNFNKQKGFCQTIKDANLLCKEIHKLEDLHKDISNTTLILNELLTKDEAEKTMEKLEEDEAGIFSIKENMVKQMTIERRASEQEEQEEEKEVRHDETKLEVRKAKPDEGKLKDEVSRIQARLENQLSLVEDLLLSANRNMMDRELQTLDRVYDDFVSAASNLRKMSSTKESEKVSELIDAEDARVFKIKKRVSKWLAESKENDRGRTECEKKLEDIMKNRNTEKAKNSEDKQGDKDRTSTGEKKDVKISKTKEQSRGKEVFEKEDDKEKENTKKEETAQDFMKLNQLMVQTLMQQAAPKVEIDNFSGNPLEYHYFVENFRDVVESLIQEPKQRLIRLLKYTEGEAKDLIKHCVYEPRESCYKKAMSLLEKEYGNPYKVSSAYLEKLSKWPQIKAGDAAGLKNLYRFLVQCNAFRDKGMGELDSPLTIRNVQLSLPINLQDKWTFRVGRIRKNKNTEAAFKDFVEFIEEESLALNDPIYSRQGFKDKGGVSVKACLTQSKITCPLCKESHDLDDCAQFKEKATRDKKDFLFKSKLCFACYGKDHRAKECTNKRTCAMCGKEHPTSLHDVTFKVSAIHGENGDGGLCIVLVRMSHISCPEKEVEVYAMLDECSNGTFVNENIVDYVSEEFKKPTQVTVETVNVESTSESFAIDGLVVKGTEKFASFYPAPEIALPKTYTKQKLPMGPEDIPRAEEVVKWKYLQEVAESLSDVKNIPLGLLIGSNCRKALEPMQVISSQSNGPYAKRTRLGWCVVGSTNIDNAMLKCNNIRVCTPLRDMTGATSTSRHVVMQTKITDHAISNMLQEMWRSDFVEREGEEKGLSKEDNQFVKMMRENIIFKSGHYELPLPLRAISESKTQQGHSTKDQKTENTRKENKVEIITPEEAMGINKEKAHADSEKDKIAKYVAMPDNKNMALQRARCLKRKMLKDNNFRKEYNTFMGKLFTKGYARKVPKDRVNERAWYIPHHGVYHPVKKKVRGVFDCSATKDGISLNSQLIQGPDPANSLLGVLFRFRKGLIGFMADIETMYYQVSIPEEHSKFLRFYWWEDDNLDKDPDVCEMCVHPFGAISSKGCVIFALHQTALDNKDKYGTDALETLLHDFYVDDLLKSLDDEKKVIDLINRVSGMCSAGGFNLTKFVCGNKNVINSIPSEKRANVEKPLNVGDSESALGMLWHVYDDLLGFVVDVSTDDGSRRGCLSTIHRIKDPLGLLAPFLLKGRKLLQRLAAESVGWDGYLPQKIDESWKAWLNELLLLNKLKIRRCYRSKNFGKVENVTLHCFSDACFIGYGVACYLRLVDCNGNVEVALVMGKSRVSPLKPTTVPRLELTAATVSAKIGAMLIKELKLQDLETFYWVDNKIVLGYICNPNRRYRIFVANRVNLIEDLTPLTNWRYVRTKDNPADYTSRGISPTEEEKVKVYLYGPDFLRSKDEFWRHQAPETEELEDDAEVKTVKVVNVTKVTKVNVIMRSVLEIMEERISSWHRMKRVVAWVIRWVKRCRKEINPDQDLSVAEIEASETKIIKWVQARGFEKDLKLVRRDIKEKVKKKEGNLWRLNPFLDKDEVMRVGGRIGQAEEAESFRFPAILPKQTVVSRRIIEWLHRKIQHRGKHTTICEIREAGFWVVNSNKEAGAVVHACVRCKWLRGKLAEQMMADLPLNRTTTEPPFTYCGVDLFGPIKVKEGRKTIKRYGVLFTCLSLRAVHIEVASSLETDSFIQALRRFVARRGAVRELRCDNGTNFVGAENELKEAIVEMDQEKIKAFMTEQGGDWIVWEKNTPAASHMGGVWERQIRTVKSVLTSLIKSCPRVLDEETLKTFLVEAEGIVNSRPLTIENLLDPDSTPLTPNKILTMKSRFVSPPPGVFQEADVYCRKRWRISQHLANAFWSRWRKEYLQLQQVRQKWTAKKPNARVGDVVLLKEEGEMRSHWPMARVTDVHPSKDGLVRSVSLQVKGSVLKRPIHKTVLLVAAET